MEKKEKEENFERETGNEKARKEGEKRVKILNCHA